jgi:uncharacterized protein (TIGR00369 family)
VSELVDLEDVKKFMNMVPFNAVLGIQIDDLREGFCRMSVPFREEFIGDPSRPALHGGVLSAVIDTCGGAAIWTQIEKGDALSTVDLRVDYLRPGQPRDFIVEGRVLRLGNRVGVAEMIAYHPGSEGKPIASGKGVYNVRRLGDR